MNDKGALLFRIFESQSRSYRNSRRHRHWESKVSYTGSPMRAVFTFNTSGGWIAGSNWIYSLPRHKICINKKVTADFSWILGESPHLLYEQYRVFNLIAIEPTSLERMCNICIVSGKHHLESFANIILDAILFSRCDIYRQYGRYTRWTHSMCHISESTCKEPRQSLETTKVMVQ